MGENFTNVSITMFNKYETKVILDPPIPKVNSMELLSIHYAKEIGKIVDIPKFLIFCSLIDENKNYSELEPTKTTDDHLVSKQVRSKYLATLASISNSSFGYFPKVVRTKTEEYLGEFKLWVTEEDLSKVKRHNLSEIDVLICLKLNH